MEGMVSQPLPTPKQFLTSLFNTLSVSLSYKANPGPPTDPVNESFNPPPNPLKLLPASHRALLSAIHVLFPPPMLLQALDLLDRGLVTRIVEQIPPSDRSGANLAGTGSDDDGISENDGIRRGNGKENEEEGEQTSWRRNHIYQVRSSQVPRGRLRDSGWASTGGGGLIYTVRLQAWNCSCAAFAFAAFPGSSASASLSPWSSPGQNEDFMDVDDMGNSMGKGVEEWEFGGLSFDGQDGDVGGVPVCKHLLACLLGERWESVLGGYVKERSLVRTEMAGVGGEG